MLLAVQKPKCLSAGSHALLVKRAQAPAKHSLVLAKKFQRSLPNCQRAVFRLRPSGRRSKQYPCRLRPTGRRSNKNPRPQSCPRAVPSREKSHFRVRPTRVNRQFADFHTRPIRRLCSKPPTRRRPTSQGRRLSIRAARALVHVFCRRFRNLSSSTKDAAI
jgi:hypothetical protein